MVNRLKNMLKHKSAAISIDEKVPEGHVAFAMPKPAIQMLHAVETLIDISPGHPKDFTERQCVQAGALLTEIMVKSAAALEIMERLHNEIMEKNQRNSEGS